MQLILPNPYALAFNHNGSLLASGSYSGIIKIWDPIAGKLIRTLQGHTDWVESIAFNHNSSLLASDSEDRTIKIWDPITGDDLHALQGHEYCVESVAFNHNGSLLASASSDLTIKVWGINLEKLDALNQFEEEATLDEASLTHSLALCILSKDREALEFDAKEHQETIEGIEKNHPLTYQTYKPYLEQKSMNAISTNKNKYCTIL